jgi:BCD family chlorophyll transporter-like MFS transporter
MIQTGAAGTSLLALLAERVEDGRRPAAAALVWIMMILGFVVTAGVAGHHLDPFSLERLVAVTAVVAAAALALTAVALAGIEGPGRAPRTPVLGAPREPFARALAEVWAEARARRFTVFVFGSMLAYSAQDLILEPFAGIVFGMTPGESTKLGGVQHAGVLVGMIVVGLLGGGRRAGGLLSGWAVGGCIGSAVAMAGLALAAGVGPAWPLRVNVFLLGLANGVFAVAAIGSMMGLARSGAARREGTRVGLWGAAQALAFGLGGIVGTAAVDLGGALTGSPQAAYGFVFLVEAVLFAVSAHLAVQVNATLAETCPVKRAAVLPPGLAPAREG